MIEYYDYRARMYDPKIGRFISPDSVVPDEKNPQAWNRYTYVYNSPIKFIDPNGHEPCEDGANDQKPPECAKKRYCKAVTSTITSIVCEVITVSICSATAVTGQVWLLAACLTIATLQCAVVSNDISDTYCEDQCE